MVRTELAQKRSLFVVCAFVNGLTLNSLAPLSHFGGDSYQSCAEQKYRSGFGNGCLRFTVKKVVHHDDIDTAAVVGPQRGIPVDDPHARDDR